MVAEIHKMVENSGTAIKDVEGILNKIQLIYRLFCFELFIKKVIILSIKSIF